MKKYFLPFISVILIVFHSKSQTQQIINVPPSEFSDDDSIKVSDIFSGYNDLKSTNDSSNIKIIKQFDRWMYHYLPRLSITNDSVFSMKNYGKALKSWVSSDNFCVENDLSNWQSLGQLYPGQKNGMVTAIHVNPNDITKILIGT